MLYCQFTCKTMLYRVGYIVYLENNYDRLYPFIEVNFGTKWKSKPIIKEEYKIALFICGNILLLGSLLIQTTNLCQSAICLRGAFITSFQ